MITLSRIEFISSSHRLHSDSLTAEENRQIFGKCNNENGHGHNYKITVSIRGPIDPVTGMVMNLVDLKQCMQRAIVEPLDHKCLDKDVEYFRAGRVSTTENLALFAWTAMACALPNPTLLHCVRIDETEKNFVEFYGFG